ncbi:hypothetical protein F4806DRAFT_484466 [Annulohypoxylon nitens]|nr:hypothetical protein F4806DRAFT_484466 [Annulohypoxylon nitens]
MEKALNLTAACCMALFSFLGNKTAFPLSTDYEASLSSYFSIQEGSLRPACIVSPDTTEDVANAVRILTNTSLVPPESDDETCKFAIRSGGHSSNLYAANINNGITIDLRRLNSITVSPDRSMVAIGVGNTWDSVYSKLDAMDLGVTGGRTAGVGVGGLSLGGGISYFSTRYGWTSDTIINFEVVLANGSIVNANKEENRELHWALKGGGNNFGIVTRVDLRSFSQGPFWGGALYFPTTVWEHTAQEFLKFNSPHSYDEYAALTLSWGYSSSSGTAIAANMEYTKAIENPSIFAGFTSLPSLFGNTSITNMTQLSVDLRNEQVLNER